MNKRVKGNLSILLEIYNKLIKFEAISFLKQSLMKFILKTPGAILSYDKETRKDFEKSLNIQEIIYSVIFNQEMIFVREFLKSYFPLSEFFDIIDNSISKLEALNATDEEYDDQDYDELKDYQYVALINIYTQLYLSPSHSDTDKDELLYIYDSYLSNIYIQKLNSFNNRTDFEDPSTYKKSEFKFLLDYMQKFFISIKKYIELSLEDKLKENYGKSFSFSQNLTSQSRRESLQIDIVSIKKRINEVDQAYGMIFERLDEGYGKDIADIVEGIFEERETGLSAEIKRERRSTKKGKISGLQKQALRAGRMRNQRSEESNSFAVVWRMYVDAILRSRKAEKFINEEQHSLAELIFETLTKKHSNDLMVQSYKKFMRNSIDYVYTCEKANWTLFIIIFIFKINSMVLNL